jgi:hypothetical protein
MKKHFLLAMFACLLVASCTKDDTELPVALSEKPFFSKFWNKKGFFKYLLMSPDFIKAVKTEWAKLRRNIPVIRKNVGKVAQSISLSQRTNYFRWPGQVGQPLNITFDTWDEEVRHIGWFFDERVTYMDSYINSL